MAKSRLNLTVDTKGPFFDGSYKPRLYAFLDEAKALVAREGVNLVHARLLGALKHPTGHYYGAVRTEKAMKYGDQIITDRRIVYGPWLEGTSQRNKTTRFKGYKAFRKARLQLRKELPQLIQHRLEQFIASIGGSI